MPKARRKTRADVELEEYVGDLYRALGFVVTRDVELRGNQIDLLAIRSVAGAGDIRIAIEVRHRTGAPVSKEEVNGFLTVAKLLLDAGEVTKAVMVTDSIYTRHGHQAVKDDNRVALMDIRSLASQILSAESPLMQFIADYESDPISRHYLDLTIENPNRVRSDRPVLSSVDAILASLLDGSIHTAILLADYGAGKSTSLRRMKYLAARQFLNHNTRYVPLFFTLRDFYRFSRPEDYILATLRSELQTELSMATFYRFLDAGRFLVLLDGFDEISSRSSARDRARLLVTLSPLLFGNSPSVLSTRPSYFSTTAEYREALDDALASQDAERADATSATANGPERHVSLLAQHLREKERPRTKSRLRTRSYDTFELRPLSDDQINAFLATFEDEFRERGLSTWTDVRSRIDRVYDLSDLMTRPIILNMIVDTITSGFLLSGSEIELGPSHLYEAYTKAKLGIDFDKEVLPKPILDAEQRVKFAVKCALFMQEHGPLEVPIDNCRGIADELLPERPAGLSRDHVLTDLRTCSFLTTSADGTLRFVHKSFQEFFVARWLKSEIERNDWSPLDLRMQPAEVTYFLGGYMANSVEFRHCLFERLAEELGSAAPRPNLVGNLAASILSGSRTLHGLDWEGVLVPTLLIPRLALHESRLHDVSVLNGRVGELTLTRCDLNSSLGLDETEKLQFEGCSGTVELAGGITTLTVGGRSRLGIGMTGATIGRVDVEDSSLATVTGGGDNAPAMLGTINVAEAAAVVRSGVTAGTVSVTRAALDFEGSLTDSVPAADRRNLGGQGGSLRLAHSVGIVTAYVERTVLCEASVLWLDAAGAAGTSTTVKANNSLILTPSLERVRVRGKGNVVLGVVGRGGESVREWVDKSTKGLALVSNPGQENLTHVAAIRPQLFLAQLRLDWPALLIEFSQIREQARAGKLEGAIAHLLGRLFPGSAFWKELDKLQASVEAMLGYVLAPTRRLATAWGALDELSPHPEPSPS